MNDKKTIDDAMDKPPSVFCLKLIQYQKKHAELIVTKHAPYVKFFEDNVEILFQDLNMLNFSKKEGWQQQQTVQALFFIRVPRTLFSAFQQIMNGDYYESLATCRIAYEALLRILFIQKYPADWSSTLHLEKGKRKFKASRFIVDDLKIADEDRTYIFLSLPTHSQKQSVLSTIRKGTQGEGILLDPGYEFSEKEMSATFNTLLKILYLALRVFADFLGKYNEKKGNTGYPSALEVFLKNIPNRISDYPAFVDLLLEKSRPESIA